MLRRVTAFRNAGKILDLLSSALSEEKASSLQLEQAGKLHLSHLREALHKQTSTLERIVGSRTAKQSKLIENVRNYFTTSTDRDQVEALAELYPITMTSISLARMKFDSFCAAERRVKEMQLRLFGTINDAGLRPSSKTGGHRMPTGVGEEQEAEKAKEMAGYGLHGYQGITLDRSYFASDTTLWETQCKREHSAMVTQADRGYIDKVYLSDAGAKRSRALHVLESRRNMVCPLCVSLVANELNDKRQTRMSNVGLEKGLMSSVFSFCEGQADPYFRATCHHVGAQLKNAIATAIGSVNGQTHTAIFDDVVNRLLRAETAQLRYVLDRLFATSSGVDPAGRIFSHPMWKEAADFDAGDESPAALVAAEVCHRFMACDGFQSTAAMAGMAGASSVGDAASHANQDDDVSREGAQQSQELMLTEGVKLLERWDSQGSNTEELAKITENIVALAEQSHDKMVCNNFDTVQREYGLLRKLSQANGFAKLCYACVTLGTKVVQQALEQGQDGAAKLWGDPDNAAEGRMTIGQMFDLL
mgnify:CR=1 FL=1